MSEGLGKLVGGKILSAVLGVATIIVVIWYWRLPPEARAQIWGTARGALLWLGFVAAMPWALFFVPARLVRAESNLASAIGLLAYLLIDVLFAFYLAGWHVESRWQWGALVIGFLIAGVYNFAVCEFLAQRSDDSL